MTAFVDSCIALCRALNPTVLYIVSNNAEFVNTLIQKIEGLPTVIATNNKALEDSLAERDIVVKRLSERPLMGVDALIQTKDLLFGACVEGLVSENDKVLCVVANTVEALISFDVKETGITQLKESVEDRLDINILDAVLSLSFEIAREGREGKNVGALFVIGDSDNVLKYSRQLIINPFQGHSEEERNILNRENWETMKEFALLDGAFIINNEGIAVSTGRYVGVSWDIYLQGGLGGRHLAAASISKTTKAIAVTVSTSGVVRIFKDGKVIFKVSTT